MEMFAVLISGFFPFVVIPAANVCRGLVISTRLDCVGEALSQLFVHVLCIQAFTFVQLKANKV